MHLLDEDTRTSRPASWTSIEMAPNDDIASTITVLPRTSAAFEISAIGLTMPELNVARAVVGKHGKLHGARRGERAGRQEIGHVLLTFGAGIGRGQNSNGSGHGSSSSFSVTCAFAQL